MPTNGKKKDKSAVCHIRCNKRFNKFQFSEAFFSTGNSNNAFVNSRSKASEHLQVLPLN